jgi:crotonobetainyl-CoA:carnitine CoA-transferase CaiB-like acyl-CoA transferase
MLPLEGIKVVEVSTWILGPSCAAILGDWGAEVIKIENTITGDPFRWFMAVAGIDESEAPVSLFGLDNRNKRGMAIDLKQPEGRDVLYKLVEKADIFICNLPKKARERIRLDYESLSAINPRLIYAAASGYGNKGPHADKPGFDATAFWARSGLMSSLAADDTQPPVAQPGAGIGDHTSGLALFGGIAMALYNREKTGEGQQVDVSLLGVGTWITGSSVQATLSLGQEEVSKVKKPRHESVNPLVNFYKTRDGKWLYLLFLPDEPYWAPLCKATGREDLEYDERFNTRDMRLANNIELIKIIDGIFLEKSLDEWAALLDKHGLIWTHIPMTFEEVINDPQMEANGHIVEAEHPSFGPAKIITSPIRLNKIVPPVRKFAPEIGEHNEEILLETGYSWDEIGKLKDKGIIL